MNLHTNMDLTSEWGEYSAKLAEIFISKTKQTQKNPSKFAGILFVCKILSGN